MKKEKHTGRITALKKNKTKKKRLNIKRPQVVNYILSRDINKTRFPHLQNLRTK